MNDQTRRSRALMLAGMATVLAASLLRHTGVHGLSDLTLGIMHGAGFGLLLWAIRVACGQRSSRN